jgi:hypothetical protein
MELGLTNKTMFFFTEHDSRQIEFLPFINVVLKHLLATQQDYRSSLAQTTVNYLQQLSR